jgi:hypothetical protein
MSLRAAASSGASKIAIPGVDPPERRSDQDDRALGEEALEPLEVGAPDLDLLGRHRRREVVARGVDEIDPFGHRRTIIVLDAADVARRL